MLLPFLITGSVIVIDKLLSISLLEKLWTTCSGNGGWFNDLLRRLFEHRIGCANDYKSNFALFAYNFFMSQWRL